MSFSHHSLRLMHLFLILSTLICIQLVAIASSDSNDVNPHHQLNLFVQSETTYDNEDTSNSNSESDDENDNVRRSTSFLRFGRQIPSSSGSFLRFGRSNPSFLRFGRGNNNGATFLRFGRRAHQSPPNNFLRFGRKGEFLRFG